MMRRGWNWITIYLSIGGTFGFILARPLWIAAVAGQSWPHDWQQAKPLLFNLLMATGHGVLRAYAWLPSLIYHLTEHRFTFDEWLTRGVW